MRADGARCALTENPTENVAEPESIGQYLRNRRERKKLSLKQVEETTRIRVENLCAIESDEITKRVPILYARGFVKTYAEFLGADSAELIQRFTEQYGNASTEMRTPATAVLIRGRGAGFPRYSLRPLVIAVTALIAAVVFYCLYTIVFWPHRVTVRATGRVPIRVYRDGKFIWGSTIEPGKEQSWRGKKSIQLKISRPLNAQVIHNRRRISLPKGDTVSVTFDRHGVKKKVISPPEKPANTRI